MINLPRCIVLPPGVAKNFQIQEIQRFDKSDTDIIIECLGQDESWHVRNDILNNLYLHDKIPILH